MLTLVLTAYRVFAAATSHLLPLSLPAMICVLVLYYTIESTICNAVAHYDACCAARLTDVVAQGSESILISQLRRLMSMAASVLTPLEPTVGTLHARAHRIAQ